MGIKLFVNYVTFGFTDPKQIIMILNYLNQSLFVSDIIVVKRINNSSDAPENFKLNKGVSGLELQFDAMPNNVVNLWFRSAKDALKYFVRIKNEFEEQHNHSDSRIASSFLIAPCFLPSDTGHNPEKQYLMALSLDIGIEVKAFPSNIIRGQFTSEYGNIMLKECVLFDANGQLWEGGAISDYLRECNY